MVVGGQVDGRIGDAKPKQKRHRVWERGSCTEQPSVEKCRGKEGSRSVA